MIQNFVSVSANSLQGAHNHLAIPMELLLWPLFAMEDPFDS